MSDLLKLITINKPRGFGDDLGLDDWDPEKGGGSIIQQQLKDQIKGFGNVGDDFNPKGFGDDIGFDCIDPEKREDHYSKLQNQIKGFGDDLGFDGYDPESRIPGMSNKIGQNIPAGFGDDLGIDAFDPESRIPGMSSKIGQNQFAGGGSGNGSLYGNIEKNPFQTN